MSYSVIQDLRRLADEVHPLPRAEFVKLELDSPVFPMRGEIQHITATQDRLEARFLYTRAGKKQSFKLVIPPYLYDEARPFLVEGKSIVAHGRFSEEGYFVATKVRAA